MNSFRLKGIDSRVRGLGLAWLLILFLLGGLEGRSALAQDIDPDNDGSRFAYGENIGWINFKPSQGPGVTLSVSGPIGYLTGYAWGENIGWINFSPVGGGVTFDPSTGVLSGYAWGENTGWINFAPSGGGVSIDACGDFNGYAWAENTGWISFRSDEANPFRLRTSWVSPVDGIPPVTNPTTPVQGLYTTNANITFSATDCGKGVKGVYYILDGVSFITPGSTASISITAEGLHTLSFYSIDQGNNRESSKEVTFWIDKTPPAITIGSPPNGGAYYINELVSAQYEVTDSETGVVTITADEALGAPIDTSTAGSHPFTVSATDKAGNTRSVTSTYSVNFNANIDPANNGSQFAWGENVGWINLKPTWGPGVTVTNASVTGYAWGENIGRINFSPSNGGVLNNVTGNLSGHAWAENAGWIDFSTPSGGVRINPSSGVFSGYAWGENIGWINFGPAGRTIVTSWRPSNQPPSASDQTLSTGENMPVPITLAASDSNNDPLRFTVVTGPSHGTLSGTPPALTYSPLAKYKGSDSFTFKANDGQADSNVATVSITVTGAIVPDTVIDSPPVSPTKSTSATFSFHATGDPGSTFECSLDSSSFALCTSPKAFTVLTEGTHTFAVRAKSAKGMVDITPATFTWVIDTTAPHTIIDSMPVNPTSKTSATFTFHAAEPGSSLQCILDGSVFASCTSPKSYSGLSARQHTFRVRAVDPAGNVDPTPATYTWGIDRTPPKTIIDSGPPSHTNSDSSAFTFHATERSTFECNLDGSAFASCTSPKSYSGLSAQRHTFQVRAIDQAGNVDPSPASDCWEIILPYTFSGFFSPIDNLPGINAAKAGQTIPVKWKITTSNGAPIADRSSFKNLTSYRVDCNSMAGKASSSAEEHAAGFPELRYLGNGNWQFDWKTSRTYAGQCRTMVLTLEDGSTHKANFRFK